VKGRSGLQGPLWVRLTATFFGTGLIYPGPGSWAAGVTVLLCWQAGRWIAHGWQFAAVSLAAALAILTGIPASSRMARAYKSKDPDFVVIDEVAGQLVSLLGVPLSGASVLTAFVLFRAFDIVKPPPVRQLERLPAGLGIVFDDVAAGLYTAILLHLALRLHFL
jgi:phosphatidylglycerophosphatase A